MDDIKEPDGVKALDRIKGLVPEIYYDMIARVAAGVPLVALMFSPSIEQMEKVSNAAAFVLLVGLGYIAGHLLTAMSVGLNVVFWCPCIVRFFKKRNKLTRDFNSDWAISIFDDVYQRIDWVANEDANSGSILKKMEAGAGLSDNLLSGWIIILIYRCFGGKMSWLPFLDLYSLKEWYALILVTALLLASLYSRRWAFIVRQDRIFSNLMNPSVRVPPK